MDALEPSSCAACARPLAADQRWCLACGARTRVPWLPALAAREPGTPEIPSAPGFHRLPPARLTGALAVATLAAGIALGALSGGSADVSADPGARRVVAVVGAAAPAPLAQGADGAPAPGTGAEAGDGAGPARPGAAAGDGDGEGDGDAPDPLPATAPPAPLPLPAPSGESEPPAEAPAGLPPASAGEEPLVSGDEAPAAGGSPPAGSDDPGAGDAPPDDEATGMAPAARVPDLPPVRHVWVLALPAAGYAERFGRDSGSAYLASELRSQGTLLPRLDTIARAAPANGIALLGGLAPEGGADGTCARYAPPCLRSPAVRSLPEQLTGAGLTWRGYIDGIGEPCRRPVPGEPDPWTAPRPDDVYVTARNPFAYFRAITDDPSCARNVVGLDRLGADLARPETIPAFSYVALPEGDAPLRATVDAIRATDAFGKDGLILITSDGGPAAALDPRPAQTTGGLLLSPFATPGATVEQHYDPASILRSIEDLLGLDRLGLAASAKRHGFGPRVLRASPDVHPTDTAR